MGLFSCVVAKTYALWWCGCVVMNCGIVMMCCCVLLMLLDGSLVMRWSYGVVQLSGFRGLRLAGFGVVWFRIRGLWGYVVVWL